VVKFFGIVGSPRMRIRPFPPRSRASSSFSFLEAISFSPRPDAPTRRRGAFQPLSVLLEVETPVLSPPSLASRPSIIPFFLLCDLPPQVPPVADDVSSFLPPSSETLPLCFPPSQDGGPVCRGLSANLLPLPERTCSEPGQKSEIVSVFLSARKIF